MSDATQYQVRPGLWLHWGSGPFVPAEVAEPGARWVLVFSLADVSSEAPAGEMTLIHGSMLPASSPGPAMTAFHIVVVFADAVMEELLAGDKTPGAEQVRRIATDRRESILTLPLVPGARFAAESIRRCPFVGAFRAMAFAARCNDLLIEFFTAFAGAETPGPPMMRSMNDRVRAAAGLLARSLEEPPTLAALARQVGLSETTLKRGFRQVFGTTVFGYLRERRMERAHALLQNGEATVLEAAARVGYSNPSNFAAAFRRQFGVNPKAFQLTVRR